MTASSHKQAKEKDHRGEMELAMTGRTLGAPARWSILRRSPSASSRSASASENWAGQQKGKTRTRRKQKERLARKRKEDGHTEVVRLLEDANAAQVGLRRIMPHHAAPYIPAALPCYYSHYGHQTCSMFHAVIPCITSPVLLICQAGMARMHDILTIRTEFIPRITAAAPPMATKVGWDHPDYELLARAYLQLMRAANDGKLSRVSLYDKG